MDHPAYSKPDLSAKVWLAGFNAALQAGDCPAIADVLHPDAYWRDLLTFGWKFEVLQRRQRIASELAERAKGVHFEIAGSPFAGTLGQFGETIEFFLRFETSVATGRGFVRLLPVGDGYLAFTLLTAMDELKAFPERMRQQRRRDEIFHIAMPERGLKNWVDKREDVREFSASDPDVVVIGAGMAGLMAAARLGQLDLSTLVVDRCNRVGDVWRNRYHSLTLHNEICTNHFPYMPFPDTWPVYIPKDKLAGWMEYYAEAMELNVWTRTDFIAGDYDHDEGRWTVRVRRADGSERSIRPSHVIMAIGFSGIPTLPRFEGMERFKGTIMHSSGPTSTLGVEGKKVVVVGAGNSGHDIAQDLYLRGADVTMVQRSPITVVSLEPSSIRVHEIWKSNEGVRPLADVDLMAAAIPFDLLRQLQTPLTRKMAEDDRELLQGLRAAGFLLDDGDFFTKVLEKQSGYYLNVGASDLIIQGKIKLRSNVEIGKLTEAKVGLSDGSELDADILVMATGYEPLQDGVRALFGDDVAQRVGQIGGFGENGEARNMFGPTGQPGFHVVGGGFLGTRSNTRYLARLIKAEIEGIAPRQRSGKGIR